MYMPVLHCNGARRMGKPDGEHFTPWKSRLGRCWYNPDNPAAMPSSTPICGWWTARHWPMNTVLDIARSSYAPWCVQIPKGRRQWACSSHRWRRRTMSYAGRTSRRSERGTVHVEGHRSPISTHHLVSSCCNQCMVGLSPTCPLSRYILLQTDGLINHTVQ